MKRITRNAHYARWMKDWLWISLTTILTAEAQRTQRKNKSKTIIVSKPFIG